MKYKVRTNGISKDPLECLESILHARGIEDVNEFLYPSAAAEHDPFLLEDMQRGVEMLDKHIRNDSEILIVQDSDSDGLTSTAIIYNYIKVINPWAKLHYLIHEGKFHGLDREIDNIKDENYDLIIIPDAGSNDIEEQQILINNGMDILIMDHHHIDRELIQSPQLVVINNQRGNYPDKALCGAGVTYKVCQAFDKTYGYRHSLKYLDLVALGNIADVSSMKDPEVRYYIIEGLKHISNKGFESLIKAQSYSLKDKSKPPYKKLTPIDIAFYIAPLINAIIRVGTQTEKEMTLLAFIEPDTELQSTKRGAKVGDIETACEQLGRSAGNIRARQNSRKDKAVDLLTMRIEKDGLNDNNLLIVPIYDYDNIPSELTGLIAQILVSKYGKPCMLGRYYDGKLSGSIRGNENFIDMPDFKAYLDSTELMEYVQGHANAAGYCLLTDNVETLLKKSNEDFSATSFENCSFVDYIFDAQTENDIDSIGRVIGMNDNCFGNGIETINVAIKNIPLESVFPMGATKDSMKIHYNNVDYVYFKNADFVQSVLDNQTNKIDIIGEFNLNEFMGKTSVQVFIRDYEIHE